MARARSTNKTSLLSIQSEPNALPIKAPAKPVQSIYKLAVSSPCWRVESEAIAPSSLRFTPSTSPIRWRTPMALPTSLSSPASLPASKW